MAKESYQTAAKRFGTNVKYLRKLYGWSADELAKRAGLKSRQQIYNIEAGKITSFKTIIELGDVLDVSSGAMIDMDFGQRYSQETRGALLKALEESLGEYTHRTSALITKLKGSTYPDNPSQTG